MNPELSVGSARAPRRVLGALLGALITGVAQIWSYQRGRKDARTDQSLNAARELLAIVHDGIQVLRTLPHTSAP